MANMKPNSESPDRSRLNDGRRSFIRKTGAALSAVVASAAAGFSKPAADPAAGLKDEIARLSKRVGNLQDADAVRMLHQVYESLLDRGMYEDAAAIFADDAEVVYNGGLFHGKEGIRRLFCDHFAPGLTGRKIEPPPGFEPDPAQQQDIVRVAEDRKTATGQFSYSIQAGRPMTGDSSLLEMARLQGEGIVKWWEGGIYQASYIKAGESWKIRRLEYCTASKADYRPGMAYARPIEVQAFRSVFPGNPNGPDKLV